MRRYAYLLSVSLGVNLVFICVHVFPRTDTHKQLDEITQYSGSQTKESFQSSVRREPPSNLQNQDVKQRQGFNLQKIKEKESIDFVMQQPQQQQQPQHQQHEQKQQHQHQQQQLQHQQHEQKQQHQHQQQQPQHQQHEQKQQRRLQQKQQQLEKTNKVLSVRKVVQPHESASTTWPIYNFDGNEWKENSSVCANIPTFLQAQLHTTSGSVPIFIYDPQVDKWVSKGILQSGVWEKEVAHMVYRLLMKDEELALIDIGSNIGVMTLEGAALGRHVLAVDALVDNVQRLCASVKENAFKNEPLIVLNAVSNKHEKVTLARDFNNVGGTFIPQGNSAKLNSSDVNMTGLYPGSVNAIVMDDLLTIIPRNDFKKVVIKMDVEGYELNVLKGMNNFFNEITVTAIVMEWTFNKATHVAETIISFMKEHQLVPFDETLSRDLRANPQSKWPKNIAWIKSAR